MTRQSDAIAYAHSKIGDPYVWGHEGPNSFDCSGLTWASYYYGAGYRWQRTTANVQGTEGQPVSFGQLIPGDLIQPFPGHIQLYIGGHQVIEAPHTGANVRIVAVYGFWRAVRLLATPRPPAQRGTPYPGHLIREGARGNAVRLIQRRLGGLAVDGIFGPHTLAAVRHFQSAHHLAVDGIVGPHTWGAMF